MAICSLIGFPPITPPGHVLLCETEGQLNSMPIDYANILTFTHSVAKHPPVVITQELLNPSLLREDARPVFLPVAEPLLQRFFYAWVSEGFSSAMQLLAEESDRNQLHPAITYGVTHLLQISGQISNIIEKIYPQIRSRNALAWRSMTQTRDWDKSPVRCLAWHPHITKLACAVAGDSIRVYSADNAVVPVLRSKDQQEVMCIAWRPMSASELAVGCKVGVLIWHVDPVSVVLRPSPGCATVLRRSNHAPVTSLAWSANGDLLLSASAVDTTMYVWDVAMELAAPLHKLGGGGVALVTWSPDSSRVLSATEGMVFRVWETSRWSSEHWTVMSGRVQAACWGPCSSVLLFATTDEPLVYSLTFKTADAAFEQVDENAMVKALPVIDLSRLELEDGECVGGQVVSMVWDKTGQYLAIMFRESSCIAVFRTTIKSFVHVSPCCFIKGQVGELPSVISFQQNFTEGALLTIAWSSGRVQYFPFIGSDMHEITDYPDLSYSTTINSPMSASRRTNASTLC